MTDPGGEREALEAIIDALRARVRVLESALAQFANAAATLTPEEIADPYRIIWQRAGHGLIRACDLLCARDAAGGK